MVGAGRKLVPEAVGMGLEMVQVEGMGTIAGPPARAATFETGKAAAMAVSAVLMVIVEASIVIMQGCI